MPKALTQIEAEIKKIEVDLQNTPDLANQYKPDGGQLEDMKKRWENTQQGRSRQGRHRRNVTAI